MGYELNEADKENPVNAVLQGSPDFKVLGGDRKCTDILFLLLLFLSWFAMTVLGFIVTGAIPSGSLEPGDPRRLINGIDYDGRICGVDSDVKDRGKIYFMPSKQGVCVDSCPLTTDYTQFICYDEIYADVIDNATGQVDIIEAWSYVSSGECLYYMPTSDILGYCVFDQVIDLADSAATAAVKEDMASNLNGTGANYSVVSADVSDSDWFKDTCADLYAARSLISGFGFGVSTVVGTAYLFLLRIPAVLSLLVWGLAFLVFALLAAGGVIMSQTSESWAAEEEPRSHSENEIYTLQGLSYTLCVLSALWCVLMLWLRRSILLAIAITKQAARAVNDMKALVLFPVFQSVALLIFLVPWFIYTVYLASSGEITNHPIETNSGITIPAKTFTYNDNIRYAALYLLFSYFWTSEFIVAIGQIVTAMAIATWYFTRDKAGKIGTGTVVAAILTSLFYHSGTAAFGSLILAIIKTIRAVVSYFQNKAKDSRNKVVEAILACVQCCLWMLEKCMRFLNKNAYVQTAIFGDNFCMAAKKAFYLIARNVTRVAAVGIVADIVLMLGNVLIPLVSTLLFYVVADATMADELHGLVAVSFIVFLLSLFVGSLFTEVFGMAISTILQCCIADEEMFKGDDRFGEGDLGEMLDQASDHHADSSGGKVATVEQ